MDGDPAGDGDGACREAGGEGCSRRRLMIDALLAGGTAATGAAVLYPLTRFLLPPVVAEASVASVVAGKVEDFPPGSGRVFKMGSKPGILVRLADGQFRAFSAVCTHLSCQVRYVPETKLINCACHNGNYDLTGKNVSGPPPRPLEAFTAHVQGGEVIVSRGSG